MPKYRKPDKASYAALKYFLLWHEEKGKPYEFKTKKKLIDDLDINKDSVYSMLSDHKPEWLNIENAKITIKKE